MPKLTEEDKFIQEKAEEFNREHSKGTWFMVETVHGYSFAYIVGFAEQEYPNFKATILMSDGHFHNIGHLTKLEDIFKKQLKFLGK